MIRIPHLRGVLFVLSIATALTGTHAAVNTAGAYCWHPQSTICRPSICLNRYSAVTPPHLQPLSPKFQASSTCMEFGGEGSQRVGESVSYICVETNFRRESDFVNVTTQDNEVGSEDIPSGQGDRADVDTAAVEGALSDTVWYDADERGLVPVFVEPVVDDSLNRDSRWLPKAKRIKQPATKANTNTAAGSGGGSGLFGSGLTLGNLFGWFLLTALLAAAAGALIYAISRAEVDLTAGQRAKPSDLGGTPDEQTIERMKHLPAELRRTDVNLRSEAERLMREGQYDQAIILLFGHQLLLLDRFGMLRLNRGKTNRKYVRETRATDNDAAARLQDTVSAFERSYFGRHSIGQREFVELWHANEELEQEIEGRQETAA